MDERKSLLHHLGEAIDAYRMERRTRESAASPHPNRLGRFLRWLIPNGGTLLVVLALLLTQQVWARPAAQQVAAPGPSATTVNYQGRLADPLGNPLDGTYGMSFSLWDAASGGALVWGPENHPAVPVSQGLFSVGLGSLTSGGIPTTDWNGDRYLEIIVGGETLSPRELIRSVPIAGMALTVPDGAITTAKVADGAIGTAQIADGAVAPNNLALKITTLAYSWDHGVNPLVTEINWTYVEPTRHIILAQMPVGTRMYCRLVTFARAPSGGTIDLRWLSAGIAVTSSYPDWTTLDSGWVDVSSSFYDGQASVSHLEAKVTTGTGYVSRSTVLCAYGPYD